MIVQHSTTQSSCKLELLKIPPNQEEPKLWKIKYDSSCEKIFETKGNRHESRESTKKLYGVKDQCKVREGRFKRVMANLRLLILTPNRNFR